MNIYIVRHAEPDYSIDSLTEKGWREAELLSRILLRFAAWPRQGYGLVHSARRRRVR